MYLDKFSCRPPTFTNDSLVAKTVARLKTLWLEQKVYLDIPAIYTRLNGNAKLLESVMQFDFVL